LGDPDDIEEGPQDLEQCFTWDGPDVWLSEEAVEIEEEREGKMPESPGHTNKVLPPHNTSLPQGALEPLDRPSPELILAPIDVEGLLESLWGEAPQHTMWHRSQALVWALEVKDLVGEVHGYPLDLLDPYFEDPTEGEPDIALQEAWRLILDKGVCARLDPSPSPGTVTTYLDICKRASVLLEGEQNIKSPSVGCEQYAAPCAPYPFSFSPLPLLPLPPETAARGIAPGKGTTSV
jgi:hypothetical protein